MNSTPSGNSQRLFQSTLLITPNRNFPDSQNYIVKNLFKIFFTLVRFILLYFTSYLVHICLERLWSWRWRRQGRCTPSRNLRCGRMGVIEAFFKFVFVPHWNFRSAASDQYRLSHPSYEERLVKKDIMGKIRQLHFQTVQFFSLSVFVA